MMGSAVLVGSGEEAFGQIAKLFEENNIRLSHLNNGGQLLSEFKEKNNIDLVLINELLPDMTGRRLIEKMIAINPMVGCVVLSDRTPKDFHDVYEGLGVLMQFPIIPSSHQIRSLLERIGAIQALSEQIGRSQMRPES